MPYLPSGILYWSGPGLLWERLPEHGCKGRTPSQDTLMLPTSFAVSPLKGTIENIMARLQV